MILKPRTHIYHRESPLSPLEGAEERREAAELLLVCGEGGALHLEQLGAFGGALGGLGDRQADLVHIELEEAVAEVGTQRLAVGGEEEGVEFALFKS